MKVALTLEYDGTDFSGWQRQPHVRSIQQCLEQALRTYIQSICKKSGIDTPQMPKITASGRTDAGVHARAQVVSLVWPQLVPLDCYVLKGALNGLTPKQIAVLDVRPVADDFDARFSAKSKCYEYRIVNRLAPPTNPRYPAWHVPSRLNWNSMKQVAELYCGQHDFDAFRASDASQKTSRRTIYVSQLTRVSNDEILYTVVGSGFLKQMVRIMVGTLVDVGIGTIEVCDVEALLTGQASRQHAGKTAPGVGLTLNWVKY